jgi:hypothetical protein
VEFADAIALNDAIGEEHADGDAGGVKAVAAALGVDRENLHRAIEATDFAQVLGPLVSAALEAGFLHGVRWERENRD